ncbi:succinylglutamate desuccinylase/aspartoacylase family protein [Candidatus Nomurabacteria bacterium]|nr:succinylglutamate desuccinylase/aspartoacylase family protein [Candidatus Nomurabacteria bacterium]
MEDIIIKKGKQAGGISVVLAGVHGNEKCGVDAFNNILPTLEIEKGVVYFIVGSPKALEDNIRFVDVNLNRIFKNDSDLTTEEKESYEYTRMVRIRTYLDQADALLDIHASNVAGSPPFVICEDQARDIADVLSIKKLTTGFDALEPGGTDGYMNTLGKTGICIECGYAQDSDISEIAQQCIFDFLAARGHINLLVEKKEKDAFEMNFIYHTKTNNFRLIKKFDNFEEIQKGQTIGFDGDEEIKAQQDGIIIFAHHRNYIGAEAFLCGVKK